MKIGSKTHENEGIKSRFAGQYIQNRGIKTGFSMTFPSLYENRSLITEYLKGYKTRVKSTL